MDIFRLHHSQQLYFDYTTPSFDGSVGFSYDSVFSSFDFAYDEESVDGVDYVVVEEEGEEDLHIQDKTYDIVPNRSFESWSLLE